MQTVLMSVEGVVGLPGGPERPPGAVEVSTTPALADEVTREVAAADGVTGVHSLRYTSLFEPGRDDMSYGAALVTCDSLRALGGIRDCVDGDVFLAEDEYQPAPKTGTVLEWRQFPPVKGPDFDPEDYTVTGSWRVPATAKTYTVGPTSNVYSTIVLTPGAIDPAGLPKDDSTTVYAAVDQNLTADQLEGIRNSVADHRLQTYVFSYNTGPDLNTSQQTYVAIRTALYAGSIFTLLLAGVSLLVLALEHIRERRRTLAMLTASGVPRGVLARSLLWQVALPIVLGVAVALITGVGLAALVMRLSHDPVVIDWAGVTLLCAGAIALSLAVSTMTLPFLRNATRLTAMRTE
jgi:hypothetical protein